MVAHFFQVGPIPIVIAITTPENAIDKSLAIISMDFNQSHITRRNEYKKC
jgi:hypothetical protein